MESDLWKVCREFQDGVDAYLALFPSNPISSYSSEDARQMLEMESEAYEPCDLVYRVNAVLERPYQRLKSRFVEGEGLHLLHEFLQDSNALIETMLENPAAKRDHLLRLYFLNALFPHANLVEGAVSFKSHWSGFAASFVNRKIIERIRTSYEQQREGIISIMLEVQHGYRQRNFSDGGILDGWLGLLERFGDKARAVLRTGAQISFTMTAEEVRAYRHSLSHAPEPNLFMQVLLEDERFLAAFRHEQSLAWPRVLTNLLYMIIPALGLTILDRMALCYFAHRAVEDHFKCDLTNVLRKTISRVLGTGEIYKTSQN
jgi:hypothetical protein